MMTRREFGTDVQSPAMDDALRLGSERHSISCAVGPDSTETANDIQAPMTVQQREKRNCYL
jgi:hypothetical protein